ncbi:VOC family protein [Brevibacillus sp. SYSU BS000544]|uniref:VOC family protein n=1 Tax=Brevibacillus sp. SYSU BS000544 TaxID=3416443 RepID=UPI003CE4BF4F
MFQLDRLVYVTSQPEEVHKYLTAERGYSLVATGASFPGVATRIYPFTGGGFLEVAYIENEELVTQTEGGQALKTYLEEHGDGFHTFVLETDELDRVSSTLQAEGYPVQETPVQHIVDPTGETVSFRMVGSFGHLPWFIQYDKRRPSPIGFPHAAIIRTTTLTADVALIEKLVQSPATVINYPNTHAAIIPLTNASLRIESGDEYGFGYLEPKGLLLENIKESTTPTE